MSAPEVRTRAAFGIVSPDGNVRVLSLDPHGAWRLFFREHAHVLPLAEAIAAYEAIGFRHVRFTLGVEEGGAGAG